MKADDGAPELRPTEPHSYETGPQLIPTAIPIAAFHDDRGSIGVIERGGLPFPVQRVYFLYGGEPSKPRGGHAHKTLSQMLVSVAGVTRVAFDDGVGGEHAFVLDTPEKAVLVPPGFWRTLVLSRDAVCLVLASMPYDESDYLRDYEEFRAWKTSLLSN